MSNLWVHGTHHCDWMNGHDKLETSKGGSRMIDLG